MHKKNKWPVFTFQLWLFAEQRYSHVAYLWDTRVSFAHMFLFGWDSSREVTVYPPADGPLAVYTKDEFYNYLDYALKSVGYSSDVPLLDWKFSYAQYRNLYWKIVYLH